MSLDDGASRVERQPQKPKYPAWMWPWVTAALILGGTSVLMHVPGISAQEWAVAVTFIVAHLLAADALGGGQRG